MSMTDEEFYSKLEEVTLNLRVLLSKKRQMYGPHNLDLFGEIGIAIRSYDKVNRLATLLKSNTDEKNDGKEDTWMDIAGYAILALVYFYHRDGGNE